MKVDIAVRRAFFKLHHVPRLFGRIGWRGIFFAQRNSCPKKLILELNKCMLIVFVSGMLLLCTI